MKNLQSLIDSILDTVAEKLSALSPFAKAVVPAALALVVAVVNSAISGSFDVVTITSLAFGLVSSALTYLVPNKPKPATK